MNEELAKSVDAIRKVTDQNRETAAASRAVASSMGSGIAGLANVMQNPQIGQQIGQLAQMLTGGTQRQDPIAIALDALSKQLDHLQKEVDYWKAKAMESDNHKMAHLIENARKETTSCLVAGFSKMLAEHFDGKVPDSLTNQIRSL